MKTISLTQGKVALVDDEDYNRVVQYKWCAHNERGRWYATASSHNPPVNGVYPVLRMHRYILDPPHHLDVDHIDGNGLNNQKSNIRIVTRRENLQNLHIKKSSKYPGVCFDKPAGKWLARLRIGKTRKHVGHYNTEEEAATAYVNAVAALENASIAGIANATKVDGLTIKQMEKVQKMLRYHA